VKENGSMMNCTDAEHTMLRELDAELSIEEQTRLAAHLGSCDDCRHAAAEQQAVALALRSRPVAPAPVGFSSRVGNRLDEEVDWFALVEWRRWTWRLLPVAASLLIVAAIWSGNTGDARTATGPRAVAPVSTQTPSLAAPADLAGRVITGARPVGYVWHGDLDRNQMLVTILTGDHSATNLESGRE
jgi:anti-sigma factor RsiW